MAPVCRFLEDICKKEEKGKEELIYYIESNLWQQLFVIQPIEAESEEAAREQFTKALEGKARDVIIEEVITDESRLEEVLKEEYGEEDEQETIH